MTDTIPVEIRRRTLAGTIRYLADQLAAVVPDEGLRLGLQLALHQAADRAERDARQAEIYRAEAADRERARAAVQRVRGELDRLARCLPDADGPGAQWAGGASWAIGQLRLAAGEP